jgi:hypothetical protein
MLSNVDCKAARNAVVNFYSSFSYSDERFVVLNYHNSLIAEVSLYI